ncbi:hypothetical protein [Acidimangrovimonas pyrenivorans]|uniref:Lipopolysaccharide biosynthesis protein n=1 Tax=Acidimangrovimonas pyrenivorans TaxID=2030798 RepID=A0ABV7AFW9_9RHOB
MHQHWHDIYVRRWLILLTALAAAAAAWVFSSRVTPVYEGKTTFFIDYKAPQPGYVAATPDAPPAPLYPTPESKAASVDIGYLRGREVRARLARQFGLNVGEIARKVDVTLGGEFMVDAYARDPDPRRAADIANAVPKVYAALHAQSMRKRAAEDAATIQGRLDTLYQRRDRLQSTLRKMRMDSVSTADTAALSALQADREAARKQAENLAAQIARSVAERASLDAALRQEKGYYADGNTVETTPSLDGLLQHVLDLRVQQAALSDGPNSPRYAAIERQIAAIDDAMAVERHRLATATAKPSGSLYEELRLKLSGMDATIAGLKAAQKDARDRLAAATKRFDALVDTVGASDNAAKDLADVNRQIGIAEDNLASARLQSAHAKPQLVVVEQAVPPERPIFPLPILNMVVAAFCGIIFGAYYALFVAQSERAKRARYILAQPIPAFTARELAELRALSSQGAVTVEWRTRRER